MVPVHVKRHFPLLQYLCNGKPRIVKALVQEADPEVIKVLCECSKSALYGGLNLNPSQLSKLKRYKQQLRILSEKRTSVKKKKQALQKGGFLGALLSTVVPVLASVIGGLVKK